MMKIGWGERWAYAWDFPRKNFENKEKRMKFPGSKKLFWEMIKCRCKIFKMLMDSLHNNERINI